jgi:translation initiation factor 1 (eIF-1/SUI1)
MLTRISGVENFDFKPETISKKLTELFDCEAKSLNIRKDD